MTQFDVVIVGSGAAALGAAATAAASGLSTLIVEKSRYWGGTTSTRAAGSGSRQPAPRCRRLPGLRRGGSAVPRRDRGRRRPVQLAGAAARLPPKRAARGLVPDLGGTPCATDASLPGLLPREAGRQDRPTARAVGLRRPRARAAARHLETPPGAPPYLVQIDDFDRLTMPFRTVSGSFAVPV